MERLSHQLHNDMALQAKLHGFKMKAPARVQKWSKEDDTRMKDLAQRRFDKMHAESDMKNQG